ncbi:hypothetical protein [Leisingera sp. ANG59]|uniref:hypothetical protein n=1 Tax=Leisingera sp. ANG59 TaxID=2675221 RepID=UPI001574CFB2|nr:hypothetical protein [Leisingera sp. ANG59]NSY40943.1 hypothetical protein [Leisingera sp. ANG59]
MDGISDPDFELNLLKALARCYPEAMEMPASFGAGIDRWLKASLIQMRDQGLVEFAEQSNRFGAFPIPSRISITAEGLDYVANL